MPIKELEKHFKERNVLFEQVRNGETVLCPKCNNGHLKSRGDHFIFCDSKDCNVKISFDPIR